MNNNELLIVIDGLVSDNASFNKLNPRHRERLGAEGCRYAADGSRAANGVLLVTTTKKAS